MGGIGTTGGRGVTGAPLGEGVRVVALDVGALGLPDALALAVRSLETRAAGGREDLDAIAVALVGDPEEGSGGVTYALRLVHASTAVSTARFRILGAADAAGGAVAFVPSAEAADVAAFVRDFRAYVRDTAEAAGTSPEDLEATLERYGFEEVGDPSPGIDGPRH